MKRVANTVLLMILAMVVAKAAAFAQDVKSDPSYFPAPEGSGDHAPRVTHEAPSRPQTIQINPFQPRGSGLEFGGGVEFFGPGPSSGRAVRNDAFKIRVRETRREDDESRYYTTPQVRVRSATGDFQLDATFERTYEQDEDPRPPVPDFPAPGQSIITGWVPLGKAFVSAKYETSSLHVGDSSVDQFEGDGIPVGGGMQVSLWGGIVRAGLAYVQGKVVSESTSSSMIAAPRGASGFSSGEDVYLQDPEIREPPPNEIDPPATSRRVRHSGDLRVFELDLSLTVLEGHLPLGESIAIYGSSGVALNIEYVQIAFENQNAAGLVIAPGAFVEGGVEIAGTFKIFTRTAYNHGFGLGDIKNESVLLIFLGLEVRF